MKAKSKDSPLLYLTALVLYLNYFIHGIGVSILGQYKQNFAAQWGAHLLGNGSYDVSGVIMVIAALGLGRLIAYPFAGPISDRLGRRVSDLIGIAIYIVYFLGLIYAPSVYAAYFFALLGGIANSFIDTAVLPGCMEIMYKATGFASILTKLFISLGQFMLPIFIGIVAGNHMSYKTLFIVMPILFVILAVLMCILPLPENSSNVTDASGKKESFFQQLKSIKFTGSSIALILIGFTCTSTFQLWLNCNQELGKYAGMANPSIIQSYYSVGTIIAVLLTAVLVGRVIKGIRFLLIYPLIAAVMLLIVFLFPSPTTCLVGGFVIGYAGAGGVLQLAVSAVNDLFPTMKGTITSIVMIASSVANYLVLSAAGGITIAGGTKGPLYVVLFNFIITVCGVLLALFVNIKSGKSPKAEMQTA